MLLPAAAWVVGALALLAGTPGFSAEGIRVREYALPSGSYPHDVAPAPDGAVWFTDQRAGALGRLDPATGQVTRIPLGPGSAPHGVIVGPDGAPWITDGGLNAIVRVDARTRAVTGFPLPADRNSANLNTATFDHHGVLWFTGQSGVYGRLDPRTRAVRVFDAPRGAGPYGITTTPDGTVYYASLAGSYIARIDVASGHATVLAPPTPDQGARRIWADSTGRLWVTEWNAGQLSRFDPSAATWHTWKLPGARPAPYAVYVDDHDIVWLSDWGANAVLRFDPATQRFEAFPSSLPNAHVRQLLGRPGEVWAPESGTARLMVLHTR